MRDEMFLIDMNGYKHPMTARFVSWVILSGWLFFIMAIIFNCIYYTLHPMALKVSPKDKLRTHLFGNLLPKEAEEQNIQDYSSNYVELEPVGKKEAKETDPLNRMNELKS